MNNHKRVETLQKKHAEIDSQLQNINQVYATADITEMKKSKLALKDKIALLQQEMEILLGDQDIKTDPS